jgi:hypothetical protein
VPTGYELGLGVAVQSYDGKLFFGLTADAHVAPDVARLRDYIQLCFRELCKAAGVKTEPRGAKARPSKPRKSAKPAGRVEPALTPPMETLAPSPESVASVVEEVQPEPVSSRVA